MKLLLIGATGSPYYEHCKQEIVKFLNSSKRVGIITAANLGDEEVYFRGIEERLTRHEPRIPGELTHVRWDSKSLETLDGLDAVIIPGGNTYALLKRLGESGLLDALREEIRGGLLYIGSSAGANLAGPNILTTNDWNIVGLTHFESLNLVPFNINPHYVERSVSDAPHSETRGLRIREYHQFWNNPVVGIEERAVLQVVDSEVSVIGKDRVKLFLPDSKQRWFYVDEELMLHDSDERLAIRV